MKSLFLYLMILSVVFSSCTVGKVSARKDDGLFYATAVARTIVKKSIPLDDMNDLLIVPDNEFIIGMLKNIDYFGEITTVDSIEIQIIKEGKQDEVGVITGKIGFNNLYRKYKPFLYLKFARKKRDSRMLQLKLINPLTLEELFVGQIRLAYNTQAVFDENTFNPLFNELIKYISANSEVYDYKANIPNANETEEEEDID